MDEIFNYNINQMLKLKARIIYKNEGFGLNQDCEILTSILSKLDIEVIKYDLLSLIEHNIEVDYNFFLEIIKPELISTARINIFIPNQEWLRQETCSCIKYMDSIFCKTQLSYNFFKQKGYNPKKTGFSSRDKINKKITKDYNLFLHVAGKSLNKGTSELISCWKKFPNWPNLTVVCVNDKIIENGADNITIINNYITNTELTKLQNLFGVHICPSVSEGFGHTIVEGMSTESIIITTDVPPMNELVNFDRGILVNIKNQQKYPSIQKAILDEGSLISKIEYVFRMSTDEKNEIGKNARKWYLNNRITFEKTLIEFIKTNQ